MFTPILGEDSYFDSYFSKGLVQPPTRYLYTSCISITDLKDAVSQRALLTAGEGHWICSFRWAVSSLTLWFFPVYVDEIWPSYLGGSENSGTPKSSIFNRIFHYKPSILGYHYFWKHPFGDSFISHEIFGSRNLKQSGGFHGSCHVRV